MPYMNAGNDNVQMFSPFQGPEAYGNKQWSCLKIFLFIIIFFF